MKLSLPMPPAPQPLAITNLFSVSMDLLIVDISFFFFLIIIFFTFFLAALCRCCYT